MDAEERLAEIRARGLHRSLRSIESAPGPRVTLDGREVLLLCSNDYLGLAGDERVRSAAAAAASRWGAGAGASRLVSGAMAIHRELERELARFKGADDALLAGSGYLANLAAVTSLAGRGEAVFSDELNHASIVDACRLSRAEVCVYRHADVEHLAWLIARTAAAPALVVTDGLFSMDGDRAPLEELAAVARAHGARLVVDEAHATGTTGPGGRGTVAAAGLEGSPDVLVVGTLGKALGSYGAYLAGERGVVELLLNTARQVIFSTALPPAAVAAAAEALGIVISEPERLRRLRENSRVMAAALRGEGLDAGDRSSQILPVPVGGAGPAMALCEAALADGIYCQGIRPPTVPAGSSRLRVTVMATHDPADLLSAAATLGRHARRLEVGTGRLERAA